MNAPPSLDQLTIIVALGREMTQLDSILHKKTTGGCLQIRFGRTRPTDHGTKGGTKVKNEQPKSGCPF
jgi:hypothetical protein